MRKHNIPRLIKILTKVTSVFLVHYGKYMKDNHNYLSKGGIIFMTVCLFVPFLFVNRITQILLAGSP